MFGEVQLFQVVCVLSLLVAWSQAGYLRSRLDANSTITAAQAEQYALFYETMPLPEDEYDPPLGRRRTSTSRRSLAFSVLAEMEQFKMETTLWEPGQGGRSTLVKAHYLVLPTWYEDDDKVPHDIPGIKVVMQEVSDYYLGMSWGSHSLTWQVLDPIVLPGIMKANATLSPTKNRAMAHIRDNLGLRKKADFTGVILLHSPADSGPLRWGGGFAHVNGDFVWAKLPIRFGVIRHEIGHNFGHPHHLANTYEWRVKRGKPHQFDGFNMMSGGNGFDISDFAPAAKWHYNWIPDDAVVLMQPEGATEACPTCRSSVSRLVLTSFDDPSDPPSSTRLKAVHIPVMGDREDKPNVYSYWLSYRGHGNDGLAAGGLSIHTSHFQLRGLFAATYNSLNFDANGDTETTEDSFVKPNTCYLVSPPAFFMDQSPAAVEQVQPIVCVDAVDQGKSITISVTFLDPNQPPTTTVTLGSERSLSCSAGGTDKQEFSLNVEADSPHLLHFTGTGLGGKLSLSMCVETGTSSAVEAYFYDSYPYAFLAFNSPATYGSYRSLAASENCPSLSEIEYLAEYGEAYIMLVSEARSSAVVTVSVTCDVSSCHANQYFDGSKCVNCPAGSIAPAESTQASACVPCEDGLTAVHPKTPICHDDGSPSLAVDTPEDFMVATAESTMSPTTTSPTKAPSLQPMQLAVLPIKQVVEAPPVIAPSQQPMQLAVLPVEQVVEMPPITAPTQQPMQLAVLPLDFFEMPKQEARHARGSVRFWLIHVPTNTAVVEIHDGDVIDTTQFASPASFNINVVPANANDRSIQSVKFVETGRLETSAPFAYCGDRKGNFRECPDLKADSVVKTVSVVPYPGTLVVPRGSSFPQQSVSFRLVEDDVVR